MDAVVIIIISWIILCVVVGYVAESIGRSFAEYFLLALFLSPLIGFIILGIKGKVTKDELLDNTPHIFFCTNCSSTYGGIKDQCVKCPDCGNILAETSVLRSDWRSYSDAKKEELKNAFHCGQLLRDKVQNATSVSSIDPVVELKRYKELLDSGVITQEDFDHKKKQLLNL